jgi:hypothetical protein
MTEQIPESAVGCWLDGHFGWHNNYRVIERAESCGFVLDDDDRRLVEVYKLNGDVEYLARQLADKLERSSDVPPAARQEAEELIEAASEVVLGQGGLSDKATEHLDSLAPEGYAFNWDAGELSLLCLCQIEGTEENQALGYVHDQCARCDERDGRR